MTIDTVYGVEFSGRGTTKRILENVLGCFDTHINHSLDDTLPELNLLENDVIFVAVPVFGGRIPTNTLAHIKKLHGKSTPAVAVVVYGNRAYDDALLELTTELTTNGFSVIAAAAFVAEHSMAESIAHGRPNQSDLELAQSFGKQVKTKIDEMDKNVAWEPIKVPGSTPYRTYNGVPFQPKANKNCTKCGLCVEYCPEKAIPKTKPNTTDKEKCITCMKCTWVCPQKARGLGTLKTKLVTGNLQKVCTTEKMPEIFI